jgi:transposase-like protein
MKNFTKEEKLILIERLLSKGESISAIYHTLDWELEKDAKKIFEKYGVKI